MKLNKNTLSGLNSLLGNGDKDRYLSQILETIGGCNKKQVFEIAYKQALYDARMEIATHLVGLDPNGTREKFCNMVNDLIKNTKFEGFPWEI